MARQKAVQKEKKSNTKDNPKPGKQKRPKPQLDAVKRAGMAIVCIAGAITTLSSIRWTVASQTTQGLRYVVTLDTRGMICQCEEANAGGKKICKHVVGIYKLLDREWWHRRRKRIQIRRKGAEVSGPQVQVDTHRK